MPAPLRPSPGVREQEYENARIILYLHSLVSAVSSAVPVTCRPIATAEVCERKRKRSLQRCWREKEVRAELPHTGGIGMHVSKLHEHM